MANRKLTVYQVLEQLFVEGGSGSESLQESNEQNILEEVLLNAVAVNEFTDEMCGWGNIDNSPILMLFDETGLTVPVPEESNTIDYFYLLFNIEMWQMLADQTNLYVNRRIEAGNLKPNSQLHRWKDVTMDEIKVFFALVIAMGTVRKSCIQDYWTSNEVSSTPFFGHYMSRNRFLLILSNFHIVNNDADHRLDKLFKVRPLLSMLQDNFAKI